MKEIFKINKQKPDNLIDPTLLMQIPKSTSQYDHLG